MSSETVVKLSTIVTSAPAEEARPTLHKPYLDTLFAGTFRTNWRIRTQRLTWRKGVQNYCLRIHASYSIPISYALLFVIHRIFYLLVFSFVISAVGNTRPTWYQRPSRATWITGKSLSIDNGMARYHVLSTGRGWPIWSSWTSWCSWGHCKLHHQYKAQAHLD